MATHRIHIARERYKFSCAHMTVFPDGRKERLHGHNYYLAAELELEDASFANMVEFEPIKAAMAALCDEWKERLLLAGANPHYELVRDDGIELEFRLCGERYVVPRRDALLLPIDNVSVEALSAHAAEVLLGRLALRRPPVTGFRVVVSENPGQGASIFVAI
ncbi:MAG TPA: 6-carboxytetrahydropterin synthase [Kofleriaceae bacterium]|nr:6-carboxytetrahydropterin synthase [Kofleriaceae bacterium]